jgi:stage II sporulation protein D
LRKKLEAYGADFHLGSSVLHQVYGGLSREDPRTRAAVEATRGEVLTFELEPIEAYFHSSCGGRTESGILALGRDLPYLQPVDCPCGRLPASRWELTLEPSELKASLGKDASSLAVVARSETGRARRVKIGPERTLDAVSLRERLGYARLKSLSFEVARGPRSQIRISGKGYGHGAGLCQWGAKALADQGWDYRRILAHYYPGAELQTLY